MKKQVSQNKKVFEDLDENYLDEIDEEDENDEKDDSCRNMVILEPMKEQPEFEINQFFNELPIRILNSHKMPFFYADDVAKVLGIKQVRHSIK
jgi:hypothetical protein